ncbi:hypothetical protein MLC59_11680 [Marinobacter bryozoorum]|uniref:hypothetical protein n=1 Tax=Marinobacter bryozoorum TaxID=256324 RepID=UPI0020063E85|nr:hypothetical protein [Marinobacter bryozoorum]MCK7544825.1 hypothetical protein [Marinobacter bryozoorum]
MALSFVKKMFTKEDSETKTASTEEVQVSKGGEVQQQEVQKGGHGHGEGACCGYQANQRAHHRRRRTAA